MVDYKIDKNYFPVNPLLQWFEINKRDLPWRETNDPYKIWVSEIILQQTRVNQGISYYYRFIERFPDIKTLANATEEEILKLWQGLGYYSRARNMKSAAIQVMELHNGKFPNSYKQIIELKGIGKYTAAAISSIAYNLTYAVVDGNVQRVISRFFCIELPVDTNSGFKLIESITSEILDKNEPGIFNQALMELGALICVPDSPNCENCPLNNECLALKNDKMNSLPVKIKKTEVKQRYFNYMYIRYNDSVFIQQRLKNDIWRNLYEFPLIEDTKLLTIEELIRNKDYKRIFQGVDVNIFSVSVPVRHVLTHRIINACLIEVSVSALNKELKDLIQIKETEFEKYPISRLTEILFEKIK